MGSGRGEAASGFRLRFSKTGDSRFLSHADLLRTFERALRRSGRPPAFTQGFNPHPRLAVRPALALGFEARSAALEVFLEEPCEPSVFARELDSRLPPGLRILEGRSLPPGRPSPLSRVLWRYPAGAPEPEAPLPCGGPLSAERDGSGALLVSFAVEPGRDPPGALALAGRLWPGGDAAARVRGAELARVDFEDGI